MTYTFPQKIDSNNRNPTIKIKTDRKLYTTKTSIYKIVEKVWAIVENLLGLVNKYCQFNVA